MIIFRRVLLSIVLIIATTAAYAEVEPSVLKKLNQLVEQGKYKSALSSIHEIQSSNPADPQVRFLKGLVLVQLGRPEEAIKIFSNLAIDYPELPEPHNNLAVLYAEAGRFEDARDALLMAIRTHPAYSTAHENLGDIYAHMAAAAYDKALSLDTSNKGAKTKLAMVSELFSAKSTLVETQVVQPEPKPVKASTALSSSVNEDINAILDALGQWATAWSGQDVEAYLSAYSEQFVPADGQSLSRWKKTRFQRLQAPSFIEVEVNNIDISQTRQSGNYLVTFLQSYKSNTYRDYTRKQLLMARESNRWLILREEVIR